MEELNRLAPHIPGLAEATRIAPERKESNMPSPATESPPMSAVATPSIAVEDASRPQSPETLIPATDTLSTRPTRGGVAYPFRLKVEGGDREVNASTATLASLSVNDVEDARGSSSTEPPTNIEVEPEVEATTPDAGASRPAPERFVTAPSGGLYMVESAGAQNSEKKEKEEDADNASDVAAERPGMERFSTAHSGAPLAKPDTQA